ncbi:unnamed protein product [Arctogadus glacialis]
MCTINIPSCRVLVGVPRHRSLVCIVEYSLDLQNVNFSAIRTVRVLRPLKAINRVPSMAQVSLSLRHNRKRVEVPFHSILHRFSTKLGTNSGHNESSSTMH